MDSDQLDVIERVASLGPLFYGQAYTWIKQYDMLILLIVMAGLAWFTFVAITTSPSPFWDICKNILFVFIVGVVFYRPMIFNSMTEYAPVSAKFEADTKKSFSSTGNVVLAMPYPTYWVHKSLQWMVSIASDMVRGDNRFIISEPSNTAENMATEAAFRDSQLNGSTGAWSKVMAPALLERYPALADKLKAEKPPLTYRFLNPTSGVGTSEAAAEARKVSKYIEGAGIDFAAVAGTNIGMTNAYTSPAINWTYEDGKITAPLLEPTTRSAKVASQAPPNSNKNAQAAFDKGSAILTDAADIAKKPVEENFTTMQKLYESLGNARDIATATTLGATPEQVVIYGATCQAREKACIEKLAGARDNAPVEIREASFSNGTKATLTGLYVAMSAPGAAASNGMLKQMLPYFIGMVKGLAFLAMPVLLLMAMWAGRSHLAIVGTMQIFLFVGIWNIFYVFYVGWGSSLFFDSMNSNSSGWGGLGRWLNFAIEGTVLAGMGMAAFQLVFSDLSRSDKVARGAGSDANKLGSKIDSKVNGAVNSTGTAAASGLKSVGMTAAKGFQNGLSFARMRASLGSGGGGSSPPPGAGGS